MTGTGGDGGGAGTAYAVSPDSGTHWSAEGAWPVAEGIHRIPLPLPMDGLRAVNVYALEVEDEHGTGLVLVDGGWAIPEARELLDRSLRSIGSGFGDIRRFLVTHVHRDHYTMARALGTETGAEVLLGADDRSALEAIARAPEPGVSPFAAVLRAAGAPELAERWAAGPPPDPRPEQWSMPDAWLDGDHEVGVGRRVLDAVATPGHTPGHYVFADRAAGLLLAGDHVLPTITPSIGFTVPPAVDPLGAFMASLTKVRALPDLAVLPAHGPVGHSSHRRIDALLAHHEERLARSLAALRAGAVTAHDVARELGWTRHERSYDELDTFNQGMAVMETAAHLDLLVARGGAWVTRHPDGDTFTPC